MSSRLQLLSSVALTLAPALAPALARAQITEAVPAPAEPPNVTVVVEGNADSPAFAAQNADRTLQNVAEVVRLLGTQIARSDTAAYGVSRLPRVGGYYGDYPPPPYVARYVLRLRMARTGDVQAVSAALARAGATLVRVSYPGADR